MTKFIMTIPASTTGSPDDIILLALMDYNVAEQKVTLFMSGNSMQVPMQFTETHAIAGQLPIQLADFMHWLELNDNFQN